MRPHSITTRRPRSALGFGAIALLLGAGLCVPAAAGQGWALAGLPLCLLAATAWWRRRRTSKNGGGDRLQSLERLALEPGRTLHLVRFEDRSLLLACGEWGIRLLLDPAGGQAAGAPDEAAGEGRNR